MLTCPTCDSKAPCSCDGTRKQTHLERLFGYVETRLWEILLLAGITLSYLLMRLL